METLVREGILQVVQVLAHFLVLVAISGSFFPQAWVSYSGSGSGMESVVVHIDLLLGVIVVTVRQYSGRSADPFGSGVPALSDPTGVRCSFFVSIGSIVFIRLLITISDRSCFLMGKAMMKRREVVGQIVVDVDFIKSACIHFVNWIV